MSRHSQLVQTFENNRRCIELFGGKVEWVITNIQRGDSPEFAASDAFIREQGDALIRKGWLVYLTTEFPEWNAGICKNIGHFRASGDYLINLDIDNMISIADTQKLLQNSALHQTLYHGWCGSWGTGSYGMVGMPRSLFLELGGYCENFVGFGVEDFDLLKRAQAYSGYPTVQFCTRKIIPNTNEDRVRNIAITHEPIEIQNAQNRDASLARIRAKQYAMTPSYSSTLVVRKYIPA